MTWSRWKSRVFLLTLLLLPKTTSLSFPARTRAVHPPTASYSYSRLFAQRRGNVPTTRKKKLTGRPREERTNPAVRELMAVLLETFPPSDTNSTNSTASDDSETVCPQEWHKMRSYLYQASDTLTVQQVKRVLAFLQETFPDDPVLQQSILQRAPRILRKPKSNLQPATDLLRELYGESLFRQAVSRNPTLLLTRGAGYKAAAGDDDDSMDLVAVFLNQEFGLNTAAIQSLKRTHPNLFSLSLVQILTVTHYLEQLLTEAGQESMETRKRIVAKLVVTHPHLLQLTVQNLQARVEFLRKACGLEPVDVAALLQAHAGGTLALSVQDNLKPTLSLFQQRLGLSKQDLRKVIKAHPPLLGLSIQNLEGKVEYFDRLDYDDNDLSESLPVSSSLASRVLLRAPAVYSLSLEKNIEPTVAFLAKIWGCSFSSFDDHSTAEGASTMDSKKIRLLSEYPNVLTLSLEGNLQPTVDFYQRTGYLLLDENGNLVVQQDSDQDGGSPALIRGRYLAASLFHRLLPRWHFIAKKTEHEEKKQPLPTGVKKQHDDVSVETLLSPPPLARKKGPSIPLHLLACGSDVVFCQQMSIDLQEFLDFKTQAIPRLKFHSQFDTWLKTGRPIDDV